MATKKDIEEVFNYWVENCRSTGRKPVLDEKRKRYIDRALGWYPKEDLMTAIDGVLKSPFHQGENPRNKKYDEITLIVRDAEHVEQFMDLADAQPVVNAAEEFLRRHNGT